MEEYRLKQKQKYEEWKQSVLIEEKEKLRIKLEEEKQKQYEQECLRIEEEKKYKLDFLKHEEETWLKEGFCEDEVKIIAGHLLLVHLILKEHAASIIAIQSINSVPKLFGACVKNLNRIYFFDIRLLMDVQSIIPKNFRPVIPRTDIAIDSKTWDHLQTYWHVVNPYKLLQYKTPPCKLSLRTIDDEPQSEDDIQSYMVNITSDVEQKMSKKSPFFEDDYYGAFSVSLPPTLIDPLYHALDGNHVPLAVELCIPGVSPRVYAYCRNPDERSPEGSVTIPWRLKYLLKAYEEQEIYVRVFYPPSIPDSSLPAFRIITTTELPESITSTMVKTALNKSINHQRILFPGQVILARVGSEDFLGPVPFLVAQCYTKGSDPMEIDLTEDDLTEDKDEVEKVWEEKTFATRCPVAVISVYGHGSGIDCTVETKHSISTDTNTTGFEKYYNYLVNLKKNYQHNVVSPPVTIDKDAIARSIYDQVFRK